VSGEGQEAVGVEGAHVGHAHSEPRETLHHARETLHAGEGIAVRHGPYVEGEVEAFRLAPLVHGKEPRVVDGKALNRKVELEATEPQVVDGVGRDVRKIGIVGVQGPEGHRLRVAGSRLGHPLVERPGDAGLVRVGEEAEALDPAAAQGLDHGLCLEGVRAVPSITGKPPLDGGGEPRRVQVDVSVEAAHRLRARLGR
jgi:hypothetical protein